MQKNTKKSASSYTVQQERRDGQVTKSWRADVNYRGVRLRKRFKQKGEAEAWAKQQIIELQNDGIAAEHLDQDVKLDVRAARKELWAGGTLLDAVRQAKLARDAFGTSRQFADALQEVTDARAELGGRASLLEAVRFWSAHHPNTSGITLEELASAYRRELENGHPCPGHARAVREQLAKFVEIFGAKTQAASITEADVRNYLEAREDAAFSSRRYYLGTLKRMFRFGVENHHLAISPAEAVKLKKPKTKQQVEEPECYTVENAEKLLRSCEKVAPSFAPALAILFFAGVRPTELVGQYALREEDDEASGEIIGGLQWEQVDVDGDIVISASIAKTGQRRTIQISKNLRAWLDSYGGARSGRVVPNPQAWRRAREAIVSDSGVKWIQDGARHSFASYHYALHRNRDELQAAMGHEQSSATLEKFYKKVVRRTFAEKYWSIMPSSPMVASHTPVHGDTK